MKKFAALLIGLAMAAFNAIAAVNVNTATQEQLESLNGIGPAKAKAIIDYRTKNGPFKTVEDLDKVPGIGQGVLGKIKGDVTLSGETSVKAAAKEAKKDAKADKKAEVKGDKDAKKDEKKDAKVEKKTDAKAEKEAKKGEKGEKKEEKK